MIFPCSKYHYERNLGKALASRDMEAVVADHARMSRSAEIAQKTHVPRIRMQTNRTSVGFPSNLNRTAGTATAAGTLS